MAVDVFKIGRVNVRREIVCVERRGQRVRIEIEHPVDREIRHVENDETRFPRSGVEVDGITAGSRIEVIYIWSIGAQSLGVYVDRVVRARTDDDVAAAANIDGFVAALAHDDVVAVSGGNGLDRKSTRLNSSH